MKRAHISQERTAEKMTRRIILEIWNNQVKYFVLASKVLDSQRVFLVRIFCLKFLL